MSGDMRRGGDVKVSGWGGDVPSPPSTPRAPPLLRRWVAAGVAAGMLVGGGFGVAFLFRSHGASTRAPDTPFRPGLLVGRGRDGSPRVLRPSHREVLLYVSGHCRYCRAELEAWSTLLASDPGVAAPLVVLAPDTDPADMQDRLRSFRGRWMADPSGAMGRALHVAAVPYFAVLDSAGVVVEAGVGLSSGERRAHLATVGR